MTTQSSALRPSHSALGTPPSALPQDVILSVHNVSKCFEMYEKPAHRLYQTLCAGRKKFYKEFWALRDISFDVRRGECVGIIGRNGAGKSTLLQIITGTLAPTSGTVEVHGRIAALLELGSGFNPEFTGRENVYLNASILGLSKQEIDARYDEIVAFADIGDFINQPVKTYSSGMMVRLAFAVNVFVDPELLIVDEALAVGDVAFQLKCANRMKQLLSKSTTVLFVSHDINAVRTFCHRAVWMDHGRVVMTGGVKSVTSAFLENMFSGGGSSRVNVPITDSLSAPSEKGYVSMCNVLKDEKTAKHWGTGEIVVESFFFSGRTFMTYGEDAVLRVHIRAMLDLTSDGISVAFSIRNRTAIDVVCCTSRDEGEILSGQIRKGQTFEVEFKWRNELKAGDYALMIGVENIGNPLRRYYDYVENAVLFKACEVFPIFATTRPACEVVMSKL